MLTTYEIVEIRESYGLSQVDLAKLLGWGEATISRYESKAMNGVETISTETEIFVPFKYLKLQMPEVQVKLEEYDEKYQIKVTSNTFTPFLNIDFKHCDAILSDNYFSITGLEPISVNAPKDKIRVSKNFKGTLEDDLFWETIYTTYV